MKTKIINCKPKKIKYSNIKSGKMNKDLLLQSKCLKKNKKQSIDKKVKFSNKNRKKRSKKHVQKTKHRINA